MEDEQAIFQHVGKEMITREKGIFVVLCKDCNTVCEMNSLMIEKNVVKAYCPYCGKKQVQLLSMVSNGVMGKN